MPASPCELGARPRCHPLAAPPAPTTRLSCSRSMSGPTPPQGSALAGPSAWEAVLPGLHEAGLPRCPGPGGLCWGRRPAARLPAVTPCSPFFSSLSLQHRPTGGCSVRPSGRFLLLLLEVCVLSPLFTVSPAPRRGHCWLSLSTPGLCPRLLPLGGEPWPHTRPFWKSQQELLLSHSVHRTPKPILASPPPQGVSHPLPCAPHCSTSV